MNDRLLRAAPLLLMLMLAVLMVSGVFNRPVSPEHSSHLIGSPMPSLDLPVLGNSHERLTPQLWRGRVVVLHIFASRCVPCQDELPVLMKMAQSGVEIYGLAWKEKAEKVTSWLAGSNPYRMVGVDEYGQATIPLELPGVPATFIIDKDGSIAYYDNTPLTEEVANTLILPVVERLNQVSGK